VGFPDGHYHQRHAGTPQGGALDIKGILEKSWWIAVGVQPAVTSWKLFVSFSQVQVEVQSYM